MRNERDLEYETNQGDFGVKQLFRSIIVRVWFGTNFRVKKHGSYNRIIIQHYLNYYWTYWLYRNEVANNMIVQRDRIRAQYDNERIRALNRDYPQVVKYARENHINME